MPDPKVKVLAFFHAWGRDRKLQSPYHGIVSAFEDAGVDLEIICTNDLIPENKSTYAFSPLFSEQKLIKYIRDSKPTFVLSINNGGLSERVRASISCPVVKWLLDDFPHLFFHDGISKLDTAFSADDIVVCYSSILSREVEKRYPALKGKTIFLPHATDPSLSKNIPWQPLCNISFVGSCLDVGPVNRMLSKFSRIDPLIVGAVVSAIEEVRKDYHCDFNQVIRNFGMERVLESEQLNWLHLKRVLSDVVSTQDRVAGIARVKSLGLEVYGGSNWFEPLLFGQCLDCYQYSKSINTQEKLAAIYQRSKISIDIPNIQNIDSLSGRVIDVMGSGALLITKYQPDSDAFRLFGKDCPIPMYRDEEDLFRLCEYYLTHEEERLALVKRCNELVATGFDFKDRIQSILTLARVPSVEVSSKGSVTFVSYKKFRNYAAPKLYLRMVEKALIILIGFVLPLTFRRKLLNLIPSEVGWLNIE